MIEKIRNIIKLINIVIVKLILTITYILIFIPYRLFIKKPDSGWINQYTNWDFDFNRMW